MKTSNQLQKNVGCLRSTQLVRSVKLNSTISSHPSCNTRTERLHSPLIGGIIKQDVSETQTKQSFWEIVWRVL